MGGEFQQSGASLVREFRIEEDAAAVAELLREARGATPWTETDLRKLGGLPGARAYVSVGDGGVAGIAIGMVVVNEAEILNLAVKQAARRQGEGKKLVQRMLEEFRAKTVSRVFLEVRESNTGAIGFYEHLGFRAKGKRKDYYLGPPEAALVMELHLGKFTE